MIRNLFGKTIRDQRGVLWGWGIGLVAISFWLVYVYPYVYRTTQMVKIFDQLPPFVRKMIDPRMFSTAEGFFNLQPFSILAPLILAGYGIIRGANTLALEEKTGTLDLLLAQPVSRSEVFLQKTGADILTLFTLTISFWLGMTTACRMFSVSVSAGKLAAAFFSCFLLACLFYAATLVVAGATGKPRLSSGICGGAAVVFYLLDAYGRSVESLQVIQHWTPFYLYNGHDVVMNGLLLRHALILAVFALLMGMVALILFNHRNLHR